jgi:AmmeMemoRadiSam system protein A
MESIDIPPLSQRRLIELSRRTLECFVRGTQISDATVEDPHLLSSDYGAFVSLHRDKELRGCIGTCFPTGPLYETVVDMTEAAASRDDRVAAIFPDELPRIRIDISVLSPLGTAADPLSLEAGKHGVYVISGARRGVLLPQVATEHGWDMQKFLSQTCVKAGLAKNAWKNSETKIMSFTALIIEETR